MGATGPQGSTGIVTTVVFRGSANLIAVNSSAWVFFGPYVTVVTTEAQRITASAVVALGLSWGSSSGTMMMDLCLQAPGGPLFYFNPSSALIYRSVVGRFSYSATGSIVPGAGTWKVGLCMVNYGPSALNDNDWVNGWAMITN